MDLVPINIKLNGVTTGAEGENVTLTCQYADSVPPVNNVTFFENGQLKLSTKVG